MNLRNCPSVSILIATLNSAKVLKNCLESIGKQDYPKNKIEIVVGDGGSTDGTLAIAGDYKAKVYRNPLKTGEAGKAVALRQARGDLVAIIDSDNILPDKSWLKRMTEPFGEADIVGAEPWEFTHRKKDSYINRYCALLGVNDPYCYFVGNYDKKSLLSGKWTGLKLEEEDKGNYLKVKIDKGILPTIGANGVVWRTDVLKKVVGKGDYLFDTDIPYHLAEKSPFHFAKVKVGIVHLYCSQLESFYRKQKRRARDFFCLEKKNARAQTYQRQLSKQLYFILSAILILPLIFQAIRGYIKKPDRAWFFHPIACLITLWVYSTETILALFTTKEMSRQKWSQ